MGVYVSIRGWLECDTSQLSAINAIIEARDDGRYSGGWATPRQPVGWTGYIFYGADIREAALDWFLELLREIARLPASDDDGDRVTGLFLASHESNGMSEWHVRDGKVLITPGKDHLRYLDE